MNETKFVKGYKVFDPDWTCKGFQYEVGQTYEMDDEPKCCERGFHFCTKAADCFNFYGFNSDNKVAEVEALGDVDSQEEGSKCCTNKIRIVRELTWHEVLDIVNSGKCCTGLGNSGNRNSGDFNSGDRNSGNRNSGDRNSGDFNSGDWNKCSFSNGCFNTVEPRINLFNKPSEWTYRDWLSSMAQRILIGIPCNLLLWIDFGNMTDEEKAEHTESKTTGGYLKKTKVTNSERQTWWNELPDDDKQKVMSLPNFDADIFKEITGIDVGKG